MESNIPIRWMYIEAFTMVFSNMGNKIQSLQQIDIICFQKGNYAQAYEQWLQFIAINKNNLPAVSVCFARLANINRFNGAHKLASKNIQKSLHHDPENLFAKLIDIRNYFSQHNATLALEKYKIIQNDIKLQTPNIKTLRIMQQYLAVEIELTRFNDAKKTAKKLFQFGKNDAACLYWLARLEYENKQYATALKYAKAALKIRKNYHQCLLIAQDALARLENPFI